MSMETEFLFTLPKGYLAPDGTLHRNGVMRLATAADEIQPVCDPRVLHTPSYLNILILSRVITKLGTLDSITPQIIENLFTADLAFLNDLYEQTNMLEERSMTVICPNCGHRHSVPLTFTESKAAERNPMIKTEFGIVDMVDPQKDYSGYEPQRCHCVSSDDDLYINDWWEHLERLDTYFHSLSRPAKGLSRYGVTLLPPDSLPAF